MRDSHSLQAPVWQAASAPTMALRASSYTATGKRHATNQDHFLIDVRRGMFLVADGMGGMLGGEHASRMAVELLPNAIGISHDTAEAKGKTIQRIQDAFLDVNRRIIARGESDSKLFGMGTTATMALLVGDRLFIASLGDSRAYLLRGGCLWRYTVDHSMAQALVNSGVISRQAARHHRWRHKLWKFLGWKELTEGPEVSVIRLRPGDRVLLVTDGVTEALDRHAITRILATSATADLAARNLVRTAVVAGTHDDATSVVVFADSDSDALAN